MQDEDLLLRVVFRSVRGLFVCKLVSSVVYLFGGNGFGRQASLRVMLAICVCCTGEIICSPARMNHSIRPKRYADGGVVASSCWRGFQCYVF